jgi:hypothetical protein
VPLPLAVQPSQFVHHQYNEDQREQREIHSIELDKHHVGDAHRDECERAHASITVLQTG